MVEALVEKILATWQDTWQDSCDLKTSNDDSLFLLATK